MAVNSAVSALFLISRFIPGAGSLVVWRAPALPPLHPLALSLTGSMELINDAQATVCRLNYLTCTNDFTKACLAVTRVQRISDFQAIRISDSIALFRGCPVTIRP